jgi:hypothetical protein
MRRHPAVLVLAVAALLSGCGPDKELGFDLRPVSITVPRIVTPAVTLVPPPLAPLPLPLPPVVELPPVVPPPPPVLPPPAPTCPKASVFATPKVPAAILLDALPAEGLTTQQATGSYSSTAGKGSLTGSVTVQTKRLPSTTNAVGQAVDAWIVVRNDPTSRVATLEAYQLVHPSGAVSATTPGVYLVALAWDDPVRGKLTFQPSGGGLFILPNPVQTDTGTGVQYVGAGTDPSTTTTLQLTRNVTGRKRVDACGEVLDTYTVAMTGVLTAPGKQWQVAWTMQLATAYGPVDVESTFHLSDLAGGLSWDRTLRNVAAPKVPS